MITTTMATIAPVEGRLPSSSSSSSMSKSLSSSPSPLLRAWMMEGRADARVEEA